MGLDYIRYLSDSNGVEVLTREELDLMYGLPNSPSSPLCVPQPPLLQLHSSFKHPRPVGEQEGDVREDREEENLPLGVCH